MTFIKITIFAVFMYGSNAVIAKSDSETSDHQKGSVLFQENCAACHAGKGAAGAPKKADLQIMSSQRVLEVISNGAMQAMAKHLSDEERALIVEFLASEGKQNASNTPVAPLYCQENDAWFDFNKPVQISGGGMVNLHNTRAIPEHIAKLPANDVEKLTLKWAFAFPDAYRARSQPAIAGGGLFIGSGNGTVYALDAETGCVRWEFKATNEARTAITIDHWSKDHNSNADQKQSIDNIPSIYFGDLSAHVYAVNAATGELRWKIKADDHPRARISGSIVKHNDILYVPVSGGIYSSDLCCTFRGSLSALNAQTGEVLWKTYMTPEAVEQYKNEDGAPQYGPSGAGIWTTPVIDEKRGMIYVATGESNSSPTINGSSVIALNLTDGEMLWTMNPTPLEAYNGGCKKTKVPNIDCPKEFKGRKGLDLSLLLLQSDDRDVVVVGQKTGWIYGLDPDNNGKIIWRRSISRGDYNKANWFGMAVDNHSVFITVNDLYANPMQGPYLGIEELGLYALDGLTGEWLWTAPVSRDCKTDICRGYGAAITTIPGVVFAGSQEGYFRAFDSTNGRLLWDFDTAREFKTLNGSKASGGTIGGGAGPVVVDGRVYLNSGYIYLNRDKKGNVLLMFDSK